MTFDSQTVDSLAFRPASFDWRALVAAHIRRAPLGHVVIAALIGGTVVILRSLYADSSREVLQFARLSAVLVAAAAAVASENPCRSITATTSLRRSTSTWLSTALTGVAATALWISPVWFARRIAGDGVGLPIGGVLVELVALLFVGWLMTELISAFRGPVGAGAMAGAGLAVVVVMTLMTPHTIEWLWRGPDQEWQRIHIRWAAIAAVSAVLLAISVRDSAARVPRLRRAGLRSSPEHMEHTDEH